MSAFTVGQKATYKHPAGVVGGTIATVHVNKVLLRIPRHDNLPPLDMWFTLRKDGAYRQAGKGPASPRLEAKP